MEHVLAGTTQFANRSNRDLDVQRQEGPWLGPPRHALSRRESVRRVTDCPIGLIPHLTHWCVRWCAGACCYSSARAETSSRQKAGMSATTRPQTRLPSRNAALSTQVAPAFSRSSLMPSDPVALTPSTMPAEIATSPPWQMMPTVLFLSWTALTRPVISG